MLRSICDHSLDAPETRDLRDIIRHVRDADGGAPVDGFRRCAHLSSEGGAVARQQAIVNSEQGVARDDYGVPVGKRDLRVPSQSCRGVHGRGRVNVVGWDVSRRDRGADEVGDGRSGSK